MDMESGAQRFAGAIKKYQYVLLVILLGVFLMLIPQNGEKPQETLVHPEMPIQDLEAELVSILSQIAGVGKTAVLLTEATGSETIYQTDSGQNQTRQDTVILTDGSRQEKGLVKQVLPPAYQGALVVCQGGDLATVRLAVVEAVKSVTGLSSDCITVMKMK